MFLNNLLEKRFVKNTLKTNISSIFLFSILIFLSSCALPAAIILTLAERLSSPRASIEEIKKEKVIDSLFYLCKKQIDAKKFPLKVSHPELYFENEGFTKWGLVIETKKNLSKGEYRIILKDIAEIIYRTTNDFEDSKLLFVDYPFSIESITFQIRTHYKVETEPNQINQAGVSGGKIYFIIVNPEGSLSKTRKEEESLLDQIDFQP